MGVWTPGPGATADDDVFIGDGAADVVAGFAGDDTLSGGGGNDVLVGEFNDSNSFDYVTAGDDVLDGGAGNDYVIGGLGDDLLNGGDGDDILFNSLAVSLGVGGFGYDPGPMASGVDTLDGGAGFDAAYLNYADRVGDLDVVVMAPGVVTTIFVDGAAEGTFVNIESLHLIAGSGDDRLIASNLPVGFTVFSGSLDGGGGDDWLEGGDTHDALIGGDGTDTIIGGGGSDLIRGGAGADILDGGAGVGDRLDYLLSSAGVIVNLASGTASGGDAEGDVFSGFEEVSGSAFADVLIGDDDANTLQGQAGDDRLEGRDGDDRLLGDNGRDTLIGGAGDDEYSIDSLDDVIVELPDEGFDYINLSSANASGIVLPANVEMLLYQGSASFVAYGNDIDNRIETGRGNDFLSGMQGDDSLTGGAGDDTLDGGAGSDTAVFRGLISGSPGLQVSLLISGAQNTGAGLDTLISIENIDGSDFADALTGNDSSNVLRGGEGNDTLSGGFGDDVLLGGAGADLIYDVGETEAVDNAGPASIDGGAGDDVIFVDGGGYGYAYSSGAIDGGDGADILSIGGFIHDFAILNVEVLEPSAMVYARAAQFEAFDFIRAAEGAEDPRVFLGLFESGALDLSSQLLGQGVLLHGSAGDDNLKTSDGEDTINADLGSDFVDGGAGDDLLIGDAGDDTLNGGYGADRLFGDVGDDTYIVDDIGDVIIGMFDPGVDTVHASISWQLSSGVENLVLTGTAPINATGSDFGNLITGNAAANVINGGGGADTMTGGGGDDIYYVDDAGDVVAENSAAGSGVDTIHTSVTWKLSSNVENVILEGGGAINITGNGLGNVITGNSAANVINGGTGADTMTGGAGDDVYYVDTLGDVVRESSAAGAGADTVRAALDWSLSSNIETLILTGAAIKGVGNGLGNRIVGNAVDNVLNGGTGADRLIGGLGNDTYYVDNAGDVAAEAADEGTDTVRSTINWTLANNLENLVLVGSAVSGTGNVLNNVITGNGGNNVLNGRAGNDRLTGGAGADAFVFDTSPNTTLNRDRILDFNVADDTIHLNNGVFTAVGADGVLSANAFHIGAAAHDADDRLIYNATTGVLLYDRDGIGPAPGIQMAILPTGLALTNADFLVI